MQTGRSDRARIERVKYLVLLWVTKPQALQPVFIYLLLDDTIKIQLPNLLIQTKLGRKVV